MLKMGYTTDVVLYCTLLDGLCKQNNVTAGLKIFNLMARNGVKPHIAIYNGLIDALFKEGRAKTALELFKTISECGPKPGIGMYITVICGYCPLKMLNKAIQLYEALKSRETQANNITISILVDSFCKEGRINDAMSLFFSNVVTYSFMIDGYMKCWHTDDAFHLFEKVVTDNVSPNMVGAMSPLATTASRIWVTNLSFHLTLAYSDLDRNKNAAATQITSFRVNTPCLPHQCVGSSMTMRGIHDSNQ